MAEWLSGYELNTPRNGTFSVSFPVADDLRSTGAKRLQQSGIRYDRNLNARLFAFVGADFMANALRFLDLRGVYGGGLGFHAINNDATILNFLGGVNYTQETYSNGPLVVGSVPPVFTSFGLPINSWLSPGARN